MSDAHSMDEDRKRRKRENWRRFKERKKSDPEAYLLYLERRRDLERARRKENPQRFAENARKYRRNNPETVRATQAKSYRKHAKENRAYAKSRRESNRALLDSILRQVPCLACGEPDFRCLEFHHRNPDEKDTEVTRLIGWSRKRLLDELEKCEIVCANCHLRIHAYGIEALLEKRRAHAK